LIISGTGTGKTEAFLIPILDLALKGEKSVIVYPRVIQGSFANCNISLGLDLFNEGITEYI